MPALVAGIHVLSWPQKEKINPGWPGHRRAEATPFFERLCPAMTNGESSLQFRYSVLLGWGRFRPTFGNTDQRRAQHPFADHVAGLDDLHHRA